MRLKAETQAHLSRAEGNRQVAQLLLNLAQPTGPQPPLLQWAAVAAFYSAVHYVNGFLWERLGQDPNDHRVRRQFVARTAGLRHVLGAYDTLADLGWHARYTASFQPKPAVIQD